MKNSSAFTDRIAEWFESIGFTSWGAELIVATGVLLFLVILWLAMRRARLWYWKTEIQINTLKTIDDRLKNMEEAVSQSTIALMKEAVMKVPPEEEELQEDTAEVQENPLQDEGLTAVGKSGRVYTEAELEVQIRE